MNNGEVVSIVKRQDNYQGVDKVERYKWLPPAHPGKFKMIDKSELYIDHTYQREKLNELRINEFASKWDWIYCGALSVSIRHDKYYVMDGQHRKLAADKRSDISKLPCMVFELHSKAEEAGAFVLLNSQKTAVSGVDRFKAMLVAKDEHAVGVKKLLIDSGREISSSAGPTTISCLMCLWKLYKKNPEVTKKIWPLVNQMCTEYQIVDCFLRAMFYCERKADINGFSITETPYREALLSIGGPAITGEIRREVQVIGKGGERIEGITLIKMLNKKRLGGKYRLSPE